MAKIVSVPFQLQFLGFGGSADQVHRLGTPGLVLLAWSKLWNAMTVFHMFVRTNETQNKEGNAKVGRIAREKHTTVNDDKDFASGAKGLNNSLKP